MLFIVLLSNCVTLTLIGDIETKLLDGAQNTFCKALVKLLLSASKVSPRALFSLLAMKWMLKEDPGDMRQEKGGLARERLGKQLAMGIGQEVPAMHLSLFC